jgi:steroid delta-isomerase-like uncharacterized protein
MDLTATIERMLNDYNRHDAAAFASYFAEDGVLRVVATGETNTGHGEIRAGREAVWAALDYTLEPVGVHECGQHVWLEWTMNGTNVGEWMGIPPTHRRVEGLRGCSHFTFGADGLVTQDDVYFDSATMLRQLGLLPAPEGQSGR